MAGGKDTRNMCLCMCPLSGPHLKRPLSEFKRGSDGVCRCVRENLSMRVCVRVQIKIVFPSNPSSSISYLRLWERAIRHQMYTNDERMVKGFRKKNLKDQTQRLAKARVRGRVSCITGFF